MKNNSRCYCREPKGRGGKNGSIAILTLWVILFLALLTTAISIHVGTHLRLASDLKWAVKMRGVAKKALEDAYQILKEDKFPSYDALNETWAHSEGKFKEIPYAGGVYSLVVSPEEKGKTLRYGLQDEEGKIHLNRASKETLSRLLQVVGEMFSADALELASYIVDWKDENKTKEGGSPGETEGCNYAYPPFDCKNEDFEVVEELLWMPKMTPVLFQKIKGELTLWGSGRVNINTTNRNVLESLGLSSSGASTIIANRGEGRIVFKEIAQVEAQADQWGLSNEDKEALARALSTGELGLRSDVYRGVVEIQFGNKKGEVEFMINRNGETKSWKERI